MIRRGIPIRATDEGQHQGLPWGTLAIGAAGLYGGYKGFHWLMNREIAGHVSSLPYLSTQFGYKTDVWARDVLGRTPLAESGTFKFKAGDYFLNYLKMLEEQFGGIPRTFDIYSSAFADLYSKVSPTGSFLNIQMPGENFRTFRKYYETLLGRRLTEEELSAGVRTGLYEESGKQKLGLFFNLPDRPEPILRNVRVRPRYWSPVGEEVGRRRFGETTDYWAHISRRAQAAQRTYGVEAIGGGKAGSRFPFIFEGETGHLRIHPESEWAGIFGAGRRFEVPEWIERMVMKASKIGTELSTRYFQMLDQPIELLDEILFSSSNQTFRRITENPLYKSIRNRFGTGGKYVGGFVDLWARHIKRAAPAYLAVAGTYLLANTLSRTITGKSPIQWAGAGIAGIQLAHATLGEVTGLNALTRYQESVAPGSTSPLALIGAGLGGGLTAMAGEWAYDIAKHIGDPEWQWLRRHRKVEIPRRFNFLKEIPVIGKMFKGEMTRAAFAFRGGIVAGLALMLPLVPGMLGTTKTPGELMAEFKGEKLVEQRKGSLWEFCLDPMTKVITTKGIKEAKDIKVGDITISSTGELVKIEAVSIRNFLPEDQMFEIETELIQHFPLRLTGNHEILIFNGEEEKYIPAKDLHEDVFLIWPLHKRVSKRKQFCFYDFLTIPVFHENGLLYPLRFKKTWSKSSQRGIPLIGSFSRDLGKLIGYYLGDGNIFSIGKKTNGKGYGIEFCFDTHETEYVEEVRSLIKKIFGLECTVRNRGKKGFHIVRCFHPIIANFFETIFTREKIIPEWIYSIKGDEFHRGIVEGLWESDGSVSQRETGSIDIRISQKNSSIILYLFEQLARWGIIPILSSDNSFLNGVLYPQYEIRIVRKFHTKFREVLHLRKNKINRSRKECYRKHLNSFVKNEKFYIPIISIKKMNYEGQVYDFSVDKNTSYLTLNGIVHNSRVPWEGTTVKELKTSWLFNLWNEPREQALYGEYYDKPLTRAVKSITDPYFFEKMNYDERPAPITGSYTSGWGPLGPLWDLTIGSILKPPMRMHEESWRPGGKEIVYEEQRPSYELGALPPEEALSPYSIKYQLGEMVNRFQTAVGLPGFIAKSIKKEITGTGSWFVNQPVLENAALDYSMTRAYYGMELGGLLGASESWRRFLPDERFDLQTRNEIPSGAPSWLPSWPVNYQEGNIYSKINAAETRLPGKGFEAVYPELAGINPEDYPDIYKLRVLGDIAPESDQYKHYLAQVQRQASAGEVPLSDYLRTMEDTERRHAGRRFAPSEGRGPLGFYYSLLRDIGRANPLEYALPISPVHKFMGPTTVERQYIESQLAPEYASWATPYKSFIKPAINVLMSDIGLDFIPSEAQEYRDIEARFDALEYLKDIQLADENARAGKFRRAKFWSGRAAETFAGVDPYKYEAAEKVFRGEERDFFRGFKQLPESAQLEMLSYVPTHQRPLYDAAFDAANQLAEYGGRSGTMVENSGDAQIMASYFRMDPERKRKLRLERFVSDSRAAESLTGQAPGRNWIGWRSDVPLKDIKMKVMLNEGLDYHRAGLWESRAYELERKPYIDNSAAEEAMAGEKWDPNQLINALSIQGFSPSGIHHSAPTSSGVVNLNFTYDNRKSIHNRMRKDGLLP